MRILEIITVPFFHARGTAFSSLNRTRVLGRMGHQIDILTYPVGEDVHIDNTWIHRTIILPFIKDLKMGPSLAKLILDILLSLKTVGMLLKSRYDCLHVHEEAAYWCAVLKGWAKTSLVYDMHSSLAEQLSNFGFTDNQLLVRLVRAWERWVLRRADAIIVICSRLYDDVCQVVPAEKVFLIENVPLEEERSIPTEAEVKTLRAELGLGAEKVVLYTGTFGRNQGLELLIETVPMVTALRSDVRYLLVGGVAADIERVRHAVDDLGAGERVIFTGNRPWQEMSAFMALADVLVSPRILGTNTPLKIYSYLLSGKPIVATDLPTHTQVLDGETAVLVEPDARAFAAGILQVLDDPSLGIRLGHRARELAEMKYSYEAFARKTQAVYDYLGNRG